MLNAKKVYVGRFIPRKERERELGEKAKLFTNVYVKNFGDDFNDETLKELFEKYGKITSFKVMSKDDGKSRGFGFVAFENTETAETAVNALNGKELSDGKILYVGRAQKKAERQLELKRQFDELKMGRILQNEGVNVYVKNLDDSVDDERLHSHFLQFGSITSAKVMMEDGRSKGFGFVCFKERNEATRAVTDMNGRIMSSKPLYVALAMRKEERKAHLASQYVRRMTELRMHQMGQIFQPGGAGGFFVPTLPQPQRFFGPQVNQIRTTPRWASPQIRPSGGAGQNQPGGGAVAAAAYPNMAAASSAQYRPGGGSGVRGPQGSQQAAQAAALRNSAARPITGQQAGQANIQARPMAAPVQSAASQARAPNYKYTSTMRNPPTQTVAMPGGGPPVQQAVHVKGQEPLTSTMLAAAQPAEQKQMLGERLFPLIEVMYPTMAGKITGMLLEIDNSELLHMLEHNESLKAKVEEAVAVLQAHQAKQNATTGKIE